MKDKLYVTGTGQSLYVHKAKDCSGACPIHNPSDHPLKDAPTHWRSDRGILERMCKHGTGHPDPDGLKEGESGVHGCCGCCTQTTDVAP